MHGSGADFDTGFRLAQWEIRPRRGTIASSGRTIHIEPRVMSVLVCLARHGNEVVTHDEFIHEVWDGRVVTDEVLSRCISMLRGMLGDNPRSPTFIETVPKVGYRLLQAATPLHASESPVAVDWRPVASFPKDWRIAALLAGIAAALAVIPLLPAVRSRTTAERPDDSGGEMDQAKQ